MTARVHLWTWLVADRDEGAESDGFTFADALMRANRLSETVLDGAVSSSDFPLW